MPAQIMALAFALMFALILVACSAAGTSTPTTPPQPDGGSINAGSELAPGLFEMEGGTVKAIGTLEWVDLEGGFWALVDNSAAGGESGSTIAVIANGDELDSELSQLEGQRVSVIGKRFEGVSIRMAGPEIVVETVEKL
ncbi:MAG: hypothetical protein KGZ89_01675 [Actinobacteria bacterium]|nr:hypothetical protein [Actinomycetota bacterium]